MKKIINLTILAMLFAFASRAIDPIWSSGPVYCLGTSGYVMDSTTGGVWSSSNTAVATVGSTGITVGLTPVSAGVATITYTVGSSYVTLDITVDPSPAAISGPSSVCSGASITLTDATTGGVWSSSTPSTATVGSLTGVVTGVASGGDYIYYTIGACYAYKYVTVDPVSGGLAAITGDSMVCIGSTITLADATSGGTWSSSDVTIATVSSAGVVTGVSSGAVTISYTVTGTCGATSVTYSVGVVPVATVTVSGPTSVSVGSTIGLTGSGSSGTWSSSSTSIATVSSSGAVTGVSAGVVTISYTGTTMCGSASTTYTVTVNPSAPISGTIYFDSTAYTGSVHVWLITYTPSTHMLEAVDSQWVTISSGTSVGYSFAYEPTDSYRVKANILDSTGSSSMYVPTYHTSSFYWYSADVINHVSTTANTGVDIHMMSGTPTTGPGFIGGDVTTGANRGTSSSAPAVGLHIYLLNSAGKVVKGTVTDATGAYSFSSLPLGSYTVFPEDLQYMTTPYSSITLTSTSSSLTVANFVQHTISYTITPVTEGVQNVTANNATINMFPNPASGMLNIEWTAKTADAATITISDVAGREVFNAPLNMAAGSGSHQINISNLTNGMYFVSIQSASTSYVNKLNVAH